MEPCPEGMGCAAADSSAALAAARQQLAEIPQRVDQNAAAGSRREVLPSKRERRRQRRRWSVVSRPELMAGAAFPGTALQKAASGRSKLRSLHPPALEAALHFRLSYSVSSASDQPRERPESEKDRSWHPEYFPRRAFCIRPRLGQSLRVPQVAAPEWTAAGSAMCAATAARGSRLPEASDARALAALPQSRSWPESEPR